MSEVKEYDGEFKDIIISIPTNTVEMDINVKVYENGEIAKAVQTLDLEGIKEAEDTFYMCCNGKYPIYELTEKGMEYFEGLTG